MGWEFPKKNLKEASIKPEKKLSSNQVLQSL